MLYNIFARSENEIKQLLQEDIGERAKNHGQESWENNKDTIATFWRKLIDEWADKKT